MFWKWFKIGHHWMSLPVWWTQWHWCNHVILPCRRINSWWFEGWVAIWPPASESLYKSGDLVEAVILVDGCCCCDCWCGNLDWFPPASIIISQKITEIFFLLLRYYQNITCRSNLSCAINIFWMSLTLIFFLTQSLDKAFFQRVDTS